MEYYAPVHGGGSTFAATGLEVSSDPSNSDEWHHPHHHHHHAANDVGETGLEESMWQLSMEGSQGHYPERPGEQECVYYMRTGLCSFGMSCRYHHPPNWKLAAAIARNKGEYPERPGQPECQYFLKTGTCKFGVTCKYHHPRDKAGLAGRVQLNIIGLPLRQGEKECAYYMRTGACKYGVTCKFHHPQPTPLVSMPGSPLMSPSSSNTSAQQPAYPGGVPWPLRSPYLHSPRLGPSGYAPVIIPPHQGVVSMPGWTTYQGPPVSPGMASPDPFGAGNYFLDPYIAAMGLPGLHSPAKDCIYPERPGQADCQYFIKTGECKFGAACRYHHPKDKTNQVAGSFLLNSMGLPLRPGAPPCTYYTRNGVCKFGMACKFDHPATTSAAENNILVSSSSSSSYRNVTHPSPVYLELPARSKHHRQHHQNPGTTSSNVTIVEEVDPEDQPSTTAISAASTTTAISAASQSPPSSSP